MEEVMVASSSLVGSSSIQVMAKRLISTSKVMVEVINFISIKERNNFWLSILQSHFTDKTP